MTIIKTILKRINSIIFGNKEIIHSCNSPPSRNNFKPPSWGTKEIWLHPKLSEFNPPKELPKIDLGAGDKKIEGWLSVDISDEFNPEIICDLNSIFPFRNNSIGEIRAYSVLEHLNGVIMVMNEIWRICADGAIVTIYVPHCRSVMAFSDPTHKNFFNEESFQYFCRNGSHYWIRKSYGIECCFDMIEEKIYHHYRQGNITVRLRAIKNLDEDQRKVKT